MFRYSMMVLQEVPPTPKKNGGKTHAPTHKEEKRDLRRGERATMGFTLKMVWKRGATLVLVGYAFSSENQR